MDQNSIIKSYKRVSGFYDITFGQVFRPGQKTVINKMDCGPLDEVLEIGIGTGLSFKYYPKQTKVIGIDISPDMLKLAKKKIEQEKKEKKYVTQMNGEQLSFPDNSFDKVVAMYVISVTQNPKKLIDEMKRVCKKDGDIYIVNHFSCEDDGLLLKLFEKALTLNPNNEEINHGYGVLLLKLNSHAKGLDHIKKGTGFIRFSSESYKII